MINDSNFCVAGYVATDPSLGQTRSGISAMSMRVAWTPRRFDKAINDWTDDASCFATVKAYRKLAENARMSLRKGDPVLVAGSLRIREYEAKDGSRRTTVDVTATSIGHDLSRGVATFMRIRPRAEQSAEEAAAAGAPADPGDDGQGRAGDGAVADPDEVFDEDADIAAEEPVAAPF